MTNMRTISNAFSFRRSFLAIFLSMLSFSSACVSNKQREIPRPHINTNQSRGHLVNLTINGVVPDYSGIHAVTDTNGLSAYHTYWHATFPAPKAGKLCFSLSGVKQILGKFKQSSFILTEVHPERPYERWKRYTLHPDHTSWMKKSDPEAEIQEYCPKEFTLTDRLRYKVLPPGEYVLVVYYYGEKLWGSKEILLTLQE